jgi:hypothetical protein
MDQRAPNVPRGCSDYWEALRQERLAIRVWRDASRCLLVDQKVRLDTFSELEIAANEKHDQGRPDAGTARGKARVRIVNPN